MYLVVFIPTIYIFFSYLNRAMVSIMNNVYMLNNKDRILLNV